MNLKVNFNGFLVSVLRSRHIGNHEAVVKDRELES